MRIYTRQGDKGLTRLADGTSLAKDDKRVETYGAIAAGDAVESDAQGRAIKATTGDTWGKARDAAAAAGEVIRVLR